MVHVAGLDKMNEHQGAMAHNDHQATTGTRQWYHWHEPGTSKAEKKLIRKLDFFILFYTCMTFFIKYLDQGNVRTAYFAQMDKDLHLKPDDLNWFVTYFSVGIIIGAPVSTCMLTVVQPRYWLPGCTMIWSFFVLFMYKAENVQTLYGLRFCCGLFEAGAYPGCLYLIGNWYTRSEISRRTGIFLFSSVFGSMCAAYIQSGLLKHMNGVMGLHAWRWLFVFNFLLGIPVAMFGLATCPDEPRAKKIWWMSEEERQLAIQRMKNDGRDATTQWSWGIIRQILTSWQLYTFVIAWALVELTCGNNMMTWMRLWLQKQTKSGQHHYSDNQVILLPTAIGFSELIFIFASSVLADTLQNRWIPFLALGAVQFISYLLLLVGKNTTAARMAAYYLGGAYGGLSPLLGGWINCSCGGNKQLRAFITAIMISVGYAVEAPAQQTVFPSHDAPDFRHSRGFVYGIGMIAAMCVWTVICIPIIERHWPESAKRASGVGSSEDEDGAIIQQHSRPATKAHDASD